MGWVSGAMAIVGALGKAKSAKQADQVGAVNAQFIQAETEESAFRMFETQKRNQATMRARQAASGVTMDSGSAVLYADAMKSANDRELAWLRRAGAQQSGNARYEGKIAKSQGMSGAIGSLAQGVSSIYGYGGDKGWWT